MSKYSENSKFIMKACIVTALLCIGVLFFAVAPVKAGERPMSDNEKIISTLVVNQVACDRGDTAACATRNAVCRAVTTQRRHELFDFIRNDYPYKAKNGAMYVTMKFGKALRDCA